MIVRGVPTKLISGVALAAGVMAAAPALASGDMGCYYPRTPENLVSPCSNSAALSPGNDTRVNLNYLQRDAHGKRSTPARMPSPEWGGAMRTTYFSIYEFDRAYWDGKSKGFWSYSGSRCQTVESGEAAFKTALEAAQGSWEQIFAS